MDETGSHIVLSGGEETVLLVVQPDGSLIPTSENYFLTGEGVHIHGSYIYMVDPGFSGVPSTMYILDLYSLGYYGSVDLPGTQTVGYRITSSGNYLYVTDPF